MSFVNLSKNIFLCILIGMFIAPILSLISIIFTEHKTINLLTSVLPNYTFNTVVLMLGVGTIALVIGISAAWFVTYYSFFGRRFFEIALFLPLSIPGYIVAYVYVNIFEFSGPLQIFLRETFHWSKGDYYFPTVKSLEWGIIIIGFNLYPYVYMLVRTGLIAIRGTVAVATTLCPSRCKILTAIALPVVRPAIAASVSFVLMEVISDFGTPQFLAIDTFTSGIYRSWFLLHDKYSACLFAFIALFFIFLLIIFEKLFRGKGISYSTIKMNTEYYHTWQVNSKLKLTLIYCVCSIPILIGFVIPVVPLLYWTVERIGTLVTNTRFYMSVFNSISIAFITSVIAVIISIVMSYIIRKRESLSYAIRFIVMGYAIPNTIVAVSVMVLLGNISHFVNSYFSFALIGTTFGLIYAYVFRFLAVSLGPIESGLNKIPREIDWSSLLMGHNVISTCFNVHIPMIRKSILVGFLLVFVDVIKELAATLIIRPFNFDTMATLMYELISDERYADAAPYALVIVLIGLISVVILCKLFQYDKPECSKVML
ncbi:Binding- protein-dependent transport systems inner membrane component [Ehrlichia canis str. Jake]|uniref:Binding-protein-dependent transport systems inner membrane component n=1 Tax=Ehrlichia canis (strain Jake) TaxID=269484 RepID=A0ACA6AVC0_EHRCJ|nr:Binding- protein-dependent transport systems inner membrane component [Ehrlichia canis str. Jake]